MSKEPFNCYEFGPYRLELNEGRLLRNGEPLPLTPKAFATLVVLVQRSGHLVEKDELMKLLWPDSFVEESNLNQHVWTLRKALGENQAGNEYIETVPKRGYRFMAEVQELGHQGFELVAERRTRTHIVTEDGVEASERPRERLPESEASKLLAGKRQWLTRGRVLAVGGLGLLLLTASTLTLRWWRSREARKTEGVLSAVRTNLTSMAVLPFKPLVASDRDEYLEMGMVDVLITKLSNIRQLKVRSISTVRKYTDLQQDPIAAGRELQVEAVLDGSIQRVGDRVRVTVRLLNVEDGTSLWADKFDEPFTNIFALQDSISERVAAALPLNLSGEEKAQLNRHYTENTEAFQLYLKGTYFWNKFTNDGTKKAIEYFQQAIGIDPNYALAYVGLSEAYNVQGTIGIIPPKEAIPKADWAAGRAIALDDQLAEAHAAMAANKLFFDWDWAAAEREIRRALELNPNLADSHDLYAYYFDVMGRLDEAMAEIKRAQELAPLTASINVDVALISYHMRQYDAAIEQYRKGSELDADFIEVPFTLGQACERKGMYREAIAECQKAITYHGRDPAIVSVLGYVYATSGKRDEAQKIAAELTERWKQSYFPPTFIALVYTGLGDKDQAFHWLDKAYIERDSQLIWIKVEPQFEPLRSDPRFAALVQQVGLK